MGDTTWKRRERAVALAMGVKRNLERSGNFGVSSPDTTPHPLFSIEIKSRKSLPKYLDISKKSKYKVIQKKCTLITEALLQASSYYPFKVPIAVFCKGGSWIQNAIVCFRSSDFYQFDDMFKMWDEQDIIIMRLENFILDYEHLWIEKLLPH